MRFTRPLVATTVALTLTSSGFLLNEALSNPAPASPATVTTSVDLSSIAIKAAGRGALVMMCREGLTDPAAKATYTAAAKANPELAVDINADCSLVDVRP